jgi:hypothetical protein
VGVEGHQDGIKGQGIITSHFMSRKVSLTGSRL